MAIIKELLGLDSIAVSLFVYDLVEFDKYSIRQQDPNIYSDTEARCLVYAGEGSFMLG